MIPITSTELSVFIPASFANLEPKPVFRLRPATPRSKRRYSQALIEEGLRFHPEPVVEAEVLRAMRELWVGDPDQLAANEARLTTFNETLRQARKDETIVIDQREAEAIMLAVDRLTDAWPMLRRMNSDNARFNQDAPKVALGQFLAGWSNVNLSFRLEDGVVPLDLLDRLEDEIQRIELAAIADGVEGVNGAGFAELTLRALNLLGLAQDAEKNSPAPSSQSDTPSGSTAAGSDQSSEAPPSNPQLESLSSSGSAAETLTA
ncbi:hypothetical protein [Sphingomonas panaciterrae]|uniref:hypothetical protein n=1 Tax=Sphingomonas panaciterrae TaxID=1462999 RepID=UPI002FF0752A